MPMVGMRSSLVIREAQGAYVTDAAGKRYLDGIGGLWCVNIGYGRKEMAQAIAEQVLKLSYSNTFTDCTNEPATELAASPTIAVRPGMMRRGMGIWTGTRRVGRRRSR